MIPIGAIASLVFILVGATIPQTALMMPVDTSVASFLLFLAQIAGIIVVTSFIVTRIWRYFI